MNQEMKEVPAYNSFEVHDFWATFDWLIYKIQELTLTDYLFIISFYLKDEGGKYGIN